MFSSTGNNFGADEVLFKDAQEDGYIVLNAKFTYDPTDEAYKAASVLEIYVPDLAIERSTETPVAVTFTHREVKGSETGIYDGGTFAKSWIKDRNTICIEKIAQLEETGVVTVYIQSLYCQLARPSAARAVVLNSVAATSEGDTFSFDSSYSFSFITERWVFAHFCPRTGSGSDSGKDWEGMLSNIPDDIAAEIPLFGQRNPLYPVFGLMFRSCIEEGWWTMEAADKEDAYFKYSSMPFAYAFLVRDGEPDSDVDGRMRIAANPLKGSGYVRMSGFDLELVPSPAFAAVAGVTGQYGSTYASFYPDDVPSSMPEFEACVLGSLPAINSIGIQMAKLTVKNLSSKPEIDFDSLSLEKNLTITLFDTSVAMNL